MANKTLLEIIVGLKDQTTSELKKIGTNVKSFGEGVKKAFHSEPVRLFRNAVAAVSAAIVGSVVEAVKFNTEIARVWTMAGGGIETFRKLREQARGLASDFGISRASIANGMYNALSAGVDKAGLESFMAIAAKVAVADGSDISVAVDGITTVLNAFKIKASETASVTDKLFQTVAMGKTTFGDLAANLATVAPIAAASEIPLEQILAHVATLTAQGTPTAQAMTQIRASIMGLNQALGDGWSKQMSYQDALKQVWQQAGNSQTGLLKLVGSSEAVQAVLGGVGINADMAAEKLRGMGKAAGAADTAFKKVDQFRHWAHLIEAARGAVSKFGEEIDKRIAPYVNKVSDALKKWTADKRVWAGISSMLDTAEKKLVSAAGILMKIKSVDDLEVAAEVVGNWLKDTLMEAGREIVAFMLDKAPAIGWTIGKSAFKALYNVAADTATPYQHAAAKRQAASETTSFGAYLTRLDELLGEFRDKNRSARLALEGAKLSSTIAGPDQKRKPLGEQLNYALSESNKLTESKQHVKKQEDRVSTLEKEVFSFADMAAQLPEGKVRAAALKLQQEAELRLQEQKTLLESLKQGGAMQVAINDAQAAINANFSGQLARLQSQLANNRA